MITRRNVKDDNIATFTNDIVILHNNDNDNAFNNNDENDDDNDDDDDNEKFKKRREMSIITTITTMIISFVTNCVCCRCCRRCSQTTHHHHHHHPQRNKLKSITTTLRHKINSLHHQLSHTQKFFLLLTILLSSYLTIQNLTYFFFGHHSVRGGRLGPFFDRRGFEYLAWKNYREDYDGVRGRQWVERMVVMKTLSERSFKRLCEMGGRGDDDEGVVGYAIPPLQFSLFDELLSSDSNLSLVRDSYFLRVQYDDINRRRFLLDHYSDVLSLYAHPKTLQKHRILLWSLCVVYHYGGVFLGDNVKELMIPLSDILWKEDEERDYDGCLTSRGVSIIDDDEGVMDFSFFAASPRHVVIKRVLDDISRRIKDDDVMNDVGRLFHDTLNQWLKETKEEEGRWTMLYKTCTPCPEGTCCNIHHDNASHDLLLLIRTPSLITPPPPPVTIHNNGYHPPPIPHHKTSLQHLMIAQNCEPSFLCNRCLRYGDYGTLENCSLVCSDCFASLLCSPNRKTIISFRVVVPPPPLEKQPLIPRIIHQTWFEQLTPQRYPQMTRLRNSWRFIPGWSYRFYDDEAARLVIKKHCPRRFLLAYDALLPGAYKADLFRYIVLLIYGGVYADIDLLLETSSLDGLLTNGVGFVVARDRPGEICHQEFCLWNGFMAVSPGHPFIVRAVERSISFILNRGDLFDFEGEVCGREGRGMENWKLRSEPGLMLTGPCALGISVNEALGVRSTRKFELGWMMLESMGKKGRERSRRSRRGWIEGKPGGGDTLILQLKRNDLGAIRLSDTERNIIVASTDLPGMPKFPSVQQQQQSNNNAADLFRGDEETIQRLRRREKPHYNLAARGYWLWGSKMVYEDDLVGDEQIVLEVEYVTRSE